jgi:putative nucleotide binding protein
MEDYAFILDYLAQGHPDGRKFHREPIAYALGESEFKLLELVIKPDAVLNIGDRIYIGKELEQRDKILHVKRRVSYSEITNAGQNELPFIIAEIVKLHEARFVRFYNESQPISTRFHMLELLPGLGKKTMWAILEERKKAPFQSFEDLLKRLPSVHHPEKLVARRIELELSDPQQKYHLFAAK